MGTNYYLESRPPCICCGRGFEDIHIGKSSAGWYFALRVYPERGITDINDWMSLWSRKGVVIRDEYGNTLSPEKMSCIVCVRSSGHAWNVIKDESTAKLYDSNYCEPGINNLLRSKIGHGCIGHGDGPWSYFDREFS